VLAAWEARKARGEVPIPALYDAMDEVLNVQGEKLAITRRIAGDIKDIWALQPRFEKRAGKSPYRLIELPRFRAGYDFLVLRAAKRRDRDGNRRLVARLPERRPRRARGPADSRQRPEKAPAPRARQEAGGPREIRSGHGRRPSSEA
jgi:hypothetical protein